MTEQQAERVIELLESINSRLTSIAGSLDALEDNTSSIDSDGRPRR